MRSRESDIRQDQSDVSGKKNNRGGASAPVEHWGHHRNWAARRTTQRDSKHRDAGCNRGLPGSGHAKNGGAGQTIVGRICLT